MCSKVALGSAAETPWPSKVLLETTSKPPVHSKVLPRRAPEPPNHAKAWPKPASRREKLLEPASWPLCDRKCNLTSAFFASAFVMFFVSVVDVACSSFVVAFVFRFCSYVCLWCSCLFRCLLVRSFLLRGVFFCNVGRGNFSKELFESAARNRRSKLLFEVTGLCSARLGHPSLCSPLLRAWICTGSH